MSLLAELVQPCTFVSMLTSMGENGSLPILVHSSIDVRSVFSTVMHEISQAARRNIIGNDVVPAYVDPHLEKVTLG